MGRRVAKGRKQRTLKTSVLVTQSARSWTYRENARYRRERMEGEHQEGTRKELGCQGVPGALGKRWPPKGGEDHT